MKKIKVALVGCGDRGCIYADYSLRNPDDMEIVAVCDIDLLAREQACGAIIYLCSIDDSVEGHLAVYAAEMSRHEGRRILLSELRAE